MIEQAASTAPLIVGFVDEGIGHSSYLVDLGDGTALVVDPRRVPETEHAEAASRGLRIAFTADTHSHADYVSGSPELAARGATFLAPEAAGLEVPHCGLRDGDQTDVGPLVLASDRDARAHTRPPGLRASDTRRAPGRVVLRGITDGRHGRTHRPAWCRPGRGLGAPAVPLTA